MTLTILNYACVVIAVQSLIVFLEVLVNFKRSGTLKNLLLEITFATFLISVAYVYCNYTVYNRWLIDTPLTWLTASLLIFFSLLYDRKFKIYIIAFALSMVFVQLLVSLYFSFVNPVDTRLRLFDITIGKNFRLMLRFSFTAGIIFIIIDLFVKILKKYKSANIYFQDMKKWAAFLVFNLLLLLISSALKTSSASFEFIGHLSTLVAMFFILLTFLFRPKFLNSSSLSISLGNYFNFTEKLEITKLQFSEVFYDKLYYLDPGASLEKLSKELNINSDDLYRFIYKNYQTTFNDLLNQNRVEYFIELVKKKKYTNYTIDALAQKSGFTSRHHLYRPFKKFHGGNPSDFIRSVME